MRYWVYILECSDGRYYTGTYRGDDPAIRASEHNTGKYPDAWTAKHLPVKLVWCSEYQRITDAIEFEQRIKRWSRAKKEAVIRGEWANSPNSPKPIPGASLKSCRTAGEPALVVRRTRASLAAHHEGYLATSTCRSPARKARSHRLAVLSLHRRAFGNRRRGTCLTLTSISIFDNACSIKISPKGDLPCPAPACWRLQPPALSSRVSRQ